MEKVRRDSSVPDLGFNRRAVPSLALAISLTRCHYFYYRKTCVSTVHSRASVKLGCPWDGAQPCNHRAKPSYFLQLEFHHISQMSRAFSPRALASGLSARMFALHQAPSTGAGSRTSAKDSLCCSRCEIKSKIRSSGPALQEANPPFLSFTRGDGEGCSKSEARFGLLVILHIVGSRSSVEKNVL